MDGAHIRQDREAGAALLSVLMLVAIMSVTALLATEAIVRATQLSRTAMDRSSVYWHQRAVEATSGAAVQQVYELTNGQLTENAPGLGEISEYPVEGGLIRLQPQDATNCFNLNAVATPVDGGWSADEDKMADYRTLLRALGLGDYETLRLSDALADWIDSDTLTRPNGAEDGYYISLAEPYRTASAPLENLSELRAIAPYTPDLIAALTDTVCAKPETRQLTLNINRLTPDQSALLVALFAPDLDPEAARQVLASRPAGGWNTIEEFLATEQVRTIAPEKLRTNAIGLNSHHFKVVGDVRVGTLQSPFELLYGVNETGRVELVWKRFGVT